MTYQKILELIQANAADPSRDKSEHAEWAIEALTQRGIAIEQILASLGILGQGPISPTGNEHLLQDEGEFKPFCELLKSESVRSYLEIGSWSGGSIEAVANFLPVGSRIVSVEQPLPPYAFLQTLKRERLTKILSALKRRGYDTHLIVGNSTHETTVASVQRLGPYDALFIDGSHLFADVASDWKNYSPMARLIGFHDIAKDEPLHGAAAFWNILKLSVRHVEFISEATRKREDGGYGIGVVWRLIPLGESHDTNTDR